MSVTACRKKRVTGRYQLQFPLVWVQDQLRGKTAERWRSEIMRAFREASTAVRADWRESFASQKRQLMMKTLTVDNRSGRRFDRQAYCCEAQLVYGEDVVPANATPKLLARCFQHSVDFIVSGGLCQSLSSSHSPTWSQSITTCASARTEKSSDGTDEEMTVKKEEGDMVDIVRVSPSSDAVHDTSEHTEHTFTPTSQKSTCFTELPGPLAASEISLEQSGQFVDTADCVLDGGDDLLMMEHHGLFDDDDGLPDLLADPVWDAQQNCDELFVDVDSNTCGSVVPVLEGSCSNCEAELAATRQQRDDALKRCAELQSQVERLKIERDALWGSSDSCFDGIFEGSLDGCFSRAPAWGWLLRWNRGHPLVVVWHSPAHNSCCDAASLNTLSRRKPAKGCKVSSAGVRSSSITPTALLLTGTLQASTLACPRKRFKVTPTMFCSNPVHTYTCLIRRYDAAEHGWYCTPPASSLHNKCKLSPHA